MKTRTATILVAALALTFTAACGDGSFGLSASGGDLQQELKGGNGGGKGGKSGGGYNCKPDKQLDVPPTLHAATGVTSMQINLNASVGSDESGVAQISYFTFEDEAGTIQRIAPKQRNSCPLSRPDDVSDFTVQAFEPGARYRVAAVGRDLCGNTAESNAIEVVMPELSDDTTPPSVSNLSLTRVSVFFASMPGIAAFAVDGESAIDRVEFLVNGQYMRSDAPTSGGLHGWSDPEGESYFTRFDSEYYGQTVEVTAVAYDVFGNSSSVSKTMTIPSS